MRNEARKLLTAFLANLDTADAESCSAVLVAISGKSYLSDKYVSHVHQIAQRFNDLDPDDEALSLKIALEYTNTSWGIFPAIPDFVLPMVDRIGECQLELNTVAASALYLFALTQDVCKVQAPVQRAISPMLRT